MRTETAAYQAERDLWVTQPRLFLRAFYVRQSGGAEYAFSRDFASGTVADSGTPKLECIKTVAGAAQQADPIAGSSSIGYFEAQLGDDPSGARNILRQIADPARPLMVAITAAGGGGAASIRNSNKIHAFHFVEEATTITVDDITGYPDMGHVTLDSEDFVYTGRNLSTNSFTGVRAGRRGTTPATHVAYTVVRNGEQLRRGTRVTLFLGYAPLPEAEYGPGPGFIKMEIQSVASQDYGMTWTLRCSDIQRFTKRRIFEQATDVNPSNLGPDHPITLFLKVWTSTGSGLNGAYDVLAREMSAAVPQELIDVAGWEDIRSRISADLPGLTMTFSEIEAQDAKNWAESQILRPLGILPYVNQAGQYSGRMITQPMFARTAAWSNFFRMETVLDFPLRPSVGALTLVGSAANTGRLTPSVGTLALVGSAATLPIVLRPSAGALQLAGAAPSIAGAGDGFFASRFFAARFFASGYFS
jgi:hypothetical protein